MQRDIDPAITAALLGKRQFARRWRPNWWRIAALAFTVGFWSVVAWGASTLLGGKA